MQTHEKQGKKVARVAAYRSPLTPRGSHLILPNSLKSDTARPTPRGCYRNKVDRLKFRVFFVTRRVSEENLILLRSSLTRFEVALFNSPEGGIFIADVVRHRISFSLCMASPEGDTI
jgi:hypothetical protein